MRPWLVPLLLCAAACSADQRGGGTVQQVGVVYAACVDVMVRSACRVLNDKSELPAADVILVAGVGRVDAKAYRALREAGEGMCMQVQTACGSQWEGAPCRTARALWGGPALKPQ